ncbi:DUF2860 domain-containing protein [Photobacterium makurazakiensis]|uniref:DUF2860 family protein n=1 Tax=Photobacterium makurazakiensis TaxID=2910234 RepID=UPI003D0BA583
MKQLFLGCILLCIHFSSFAFNKSNLSGELSINTGLSLSNSNLNSNGKNQQEKLSQQSSYDDSVFIVPFGRLNYTLDDSQEQSIYIGTSRDDLTIGTLAFEIGYHRRLHMGTKLDIAYLPSIISGEVWEDPYQMGHRKETDMERDAYRLKLSHILGSNFSVDLRFATSKVDKEAIHYNELHRDSDAYFVKGQYLTMLKPNSGLVSSLAYTNNDAIGNAASFDNYKLEATYFSQFNNHNLAITSSVSYQTYGAENPIFNKKQEDYIYKLTIAYEYSNIPNWENWSITSINIIENNQSNIGFYKEKNSLSLIGINYKF